MTSPQSSHPEDERRTRRINELMDRARRILVIQGKRQGTVRYCRINGVVVVEESDGRLSIDLEDNSYGFVLQKLAAATSPQVQYMNVPQALWRLRQAMVLDDLANL